MSIDHGITISGLSWAKKHKRDFARVISVSDPMAKRSSILQFHQHPRPHHLTLRFADLDTPADGHFADFRAARLACDTDVVNALSFDRPGESLLVHCHAGISRSTALAYAILCQRLGQCRELDAFQALLSLQPDAVPNLHVVRLADRLLDRGGAMLLPIMAHEADHPACGERRRANRDAYHSTFRFASAGDWMR